MQRAGLDGERADGDGVLEQAAEIRVVAVARARCAAPLGAQRAIAEQRGEQGLEARIVDLARKVLEEAVELVEVAVGDRQEGRRIGLARRRATDRAQLDLQLVAEALDAAGDAHEVAAIEAAREHVGVAKGATLHGAGAVAQLDGEIRRAGARHQAVLARAREDAVDLLSRAQRRNRHRPMMYLESDAATDLGEPSRWSARSGDDRRLQRLERCRRRRLRGPDVHRASRSAPSASRASIPRTSTTFSRRVRTSASPTSASGRSPGRASRSSRRACRALRVT